jgi:hypothetical protein
MYSSFSKPKPKIDPMNLDFHFMIKNHPEFFTKLSSQNFDHPPLSPPPRHLPPASGVYSGLADSRQPFGGLAGGSPSCKRRVGGPGVTLQPKIYPPTLMRNPKPKRGLNNFSNNASIFLFFNF